MARNRHRTNYGAVPDFDPRPRRVAYGLFIAAFLALAALLGGPKTLSAALGRGSQLAAAVSCETCDACVKTDLVTGKATCRADLGRDDCLSRNKEGVRTMEWCGAAARPPFGVTVRGGGLRTMTMGMAFARALGPHWPNVTHLGGTSGGTWMAAQFVYSKEFYESVVSSDESIEDAVIRWGVDFGAKQHEEIQKEAYWTQGPQWDKTLPLVCKFPMNVIDNFFAELSKLGLPITPWWMAYIGAMMLPTIPAIGSARYADTVPEGLQTATLVQQLSVPPTAFIDSSNREATRSSQYSGADADLVRQAVVPAAYVVPAPAGGEGEPFWAFNPQLGELTAIVKDEPVKPVLSSNPFLLEVISGSSAAGGLIAVESMIDARIDAQPGLGPGETRTLKRCVPFGMESLAPASLPEDIERLSGETIEEANAVAKAARFRFIDGGFVDDQCAAQTLAEMQKSNSGAPMKLLLVSTDNYSTAPLFEGGVGTEAPIAFRPYYGGYYATSQQIFLETFPNEKYWETYASTMFPKEVSLEPPGRIESFEPVISTYWHGTVSTRDNAWFGTTAGDRVDLLIFHSNYPGVDVPLVVPAGLSEFLFTRIYGPLARVQAEGAQPVIDAWLDGTLPDTPTMTWPEWSDDP